MKKVLFLVFILGFFSAHADVAIVPSVTADFSSSEILTSINHNVTFTDLSTAQLTNITSWQWDFNGDGVVDQNNNNNNQVNHQFIIPGIYPVILKVSDGIRTSTKTRLLTIVGLDSDTCYTYIPVQGLESEKMGAAAWETYAGAPEPAKWGHTVPSPPASIGWAYYYLGSRDYGGIDAQSSGAMHATNGIDGWPNLTAALANNGFTPTDLTVSFGVMSLGNDVQGVDWTLVGDRETRYYKGGTFNIKLKGENMINGIMPEFTMYIDYFMYLGGTDKISGKTGLGVPVNNSAASSQAVKNVAAAFMADCEHFNLHYLFSSIQTASQFEFYRNNRYGGFFEIQQGFILKACPCAAIIPNAGDTLWTRANQAQQLNLNVNGGVAPLTYNWSPVAGLNNSTAQNPVFNFNESKTYTVTVTDARGCTGQTTKRIEVVDFASIHGLVKNITSNLLLSEVKIKLDGGGRLDSLLNEKDGSYAFANIIPGRNYIMTGTRQHYQLYQTNNLNLNPGESRELNIHMTQDIDTKNNSFENNQENSLIVNNKTIIVKNIDKNSDVILFDITGRILNSQTAKDKIVSFDINKKGIYLIQFQRNKQNVLIKTVF